MKTTLIKIKKPSVSLIFLFSLVVLTASNSIQAQMVAENDRIGWSSDGNMHDPDDWSATPLALAIFDKMEWHDKLVHFDYNNRLDNTLEWKEEQNYESTVVGAKRFGFNTDLFFDDQKELEAAIENAKKEINKSHEGSRFWYVQAGPFEVAYQAILRAEPDKRKYCILVSHAEINERTDKWKLDDGSPSHGRAECVALGASFFSTTGQGKTKFGGRAYDGWDQVEWMKTSENENYQWMHSRFLETAKHKDNGLDASDGGMAYVLATGDLNGNFAPKLETFLKSDLPKEGKWKSLFNGKSLKGWHVECIEADREKEYWSVKDGAIECNSIGDGDHDYIWLFTDKEYDNFELKLKFQAYKKGTKGNSGLQVRSRYDDSPDAPRGGWLDGPQIDIHPLGPWRTGLVYDETRGARGWIYPDIPGSAMNEEQGAPTYLFHFADDDDSWNDLRVVCKGTKIKTMLNGVIVCDEDFAGVIDSDAHKKYDVGINGHIALQLHAKSQLKIRFKDIYINEL
jgi:hypothetical protein